MKKRMHKIVEEDGYSLWEYFPTLFRPFYCKLDKQSFVRRVRLLLEYLSKGKYKVYYLVIDGKIVGYSVFTPGGRRLKCSTSNDLVSGPSFISPEYRGRGYAAILKRMIIKYCCNDYRYIYSWIDKKNIASIKSCQKVGFDMTYGELVIQGKLRTLKQVSKGEGTNIIVRYKL